MHDAIPPQRLISRIPSDHPLKRAVEATVIDALAVTEGWTCKILASRAITVWLLEFIHLGDDHKEICFVRPDQFDSDDFRFLVAATLRNA
jgi:hypothetical protein